MDMGYTIEELTDNLPDYINNKIEDDNLKDAIKNEISINSDFKKEFDLLRDTLIIINNVEFTEPPANYFDTLLPRINYRIFEKSNRLKFTKNFASLWKFAVPVAAIILFFIGYKTIFKDNEYINNLNSDSQIVAEKYNYSDEKKVDSSTESEENVNFKNNDNPDKYTEAANDNIKSGISKKFKQEKNYTVKSDDNINTLLDFSDNSSDEDNFFSDDDINYEQDFDKLSNEEQNNIISKIKNSNL